MEKEAIARFSRDFFDKWYEAPLPYQKEDKTWRIGMYQAMPHHAKYQFLSRSAFLPRQGKKQF